MDELRQKFMIVVERLLDEETEIEKEQELLKKLMEGEYPDSEIDKLLETFDL